MRQRAHTHSTDNSCQDPAADAHCRCVDQRRHCRRKEVGTRKARRTYMHAQDTHHITHARIQTERETWAPGKASTAKGRMPLLTGLPRRRAEAQSLVPAWQQPAVLATNQQCLQHHHLQPQAQPWSLAFRRTFVSLGAKSLRMLAGFRTRSWRPNYHQG